MRSRVSTSTFPSFSRNDASSTYRRRFSAPTTSVQREIATGQFTVVLMTNSNGRPTSEAHQAANSMGARIFMWGEFLSELAR